MRRGISCSRKAAAEVTLVLQVGPRATTRQLPRAKARARVERGSAQRSFRLHRDSTWNCRDWRGALVAPRVRKPIKRSALLADKHLVGGRQFAEPPERTALSRGR